jgi:hypothetical protein
MLYDVGEGFLDDPVSRKRNHRGYLLGASVLVESDWQPSGPGPGDKAVQLSQGWLGRAWRVRMGFVMGNLAGSFVLRARLGLRYKDPAGMLVQAKSSEHVTQFRHSRAPTHDHRVEHRPRRMIWGQGLSNCSSLDHEEAYVVGYDVVQFPCNANPLGCHGSHRPPPLLTLSLLRPLSQCLKHGALVADRDAHRYGAADQSHLRDGAAKIRQKGPTARKSSQAKSDLCERRHEDRASGDFQRRCVVHGEKHEEDSPVTSEA